MYLVSGDGKAKTIHNIKSTHGFIAFEDGEVTRNIKFIDL
jgi:hypothetical protein